MRAGLRPLVTKMKSELNEHDETLIELSRAEAYEAILFLINQLADEENQVIKYTAFNSEE